MRQVLIYSQKKTRFHGKYWKWVVAGPYLITGKFNWHELVAGKKHENENLLNVNHIRDHVCNTDDLYGEI